eukprot:2653388-Rhodomonas_salina.1
MQHKLGNHNQETHSCGNRGFETRISQGSPPELLLVVVNKGEEVLFGEGVDLAFGKRRDLIRLRAMHHMRVGFRGS